MPTIRERNGKFQAQVRIKRNGLIVHKDTATFDTKALAKTWGESIESSYNSGTHKLLSQRTTQRIDPCA